MRDAAGRSAQMRASETVRRVRRGERRERQGRRAGREGGSVKSSEWSASAAASSLFLLAPGEGDAAAAV